MAKKKKSVAAQLSENEELDMTSMIDVVFLLIIFFLCVTELADASKEKLELPRAERVTEDEHEQGRLVINVNKDGEVYIQRHQHTDAELGQQLDLEKRLSWSTTDNLPTRAILIRVDAETKFLHVFKVMAMCMERRL